MQVLLVGLNHGTTPLELRERVVFSAEQASQAAAQLLERGVADEALVLSTCNRSELYCFAGAGAEDAEAAMEGSFSAFHPVSKDELNGCLYRRRDAEAVRHLFRVAAGLDSMLLGEAEILGQVREAYRRALEQGVTGPVLNRMFQGALEVGKRVRAETEVGTRPMSVALAGVKLAERVFGNLRRHQALIVGAGEMGQQAVEQLRSRGVARLLVVSRTRARAEELAHRVGAQVADWAALSHVLEFPEIVVTSVAGEEVVLTRAMLEQAMAARKNRSMFIIDLGVPRNVDPSVADLYNLYLYNVDNLVEIVEQNRKAREQEIPRAESIIAEHVGKFEAWRAGLAAVSLIDELKAKLEQRRREFLAQRAQGLAHLSPEDQQQIARLTEELLDELLKEPASRLRHARGQRQKLQEIEAVRKLFGLDQEEP